jgi:hypothetical protein
MATTHRSVSGVCVAKNGVPFRARIVRQGDTYGLDHCLTHDKADPMIEFYDARYASVLSEHTISVAQGFAPEGQFVSRYYLSTFLAHGNSGLCLDGGVDDWTLDAATVGAFRNWVRSLGISIKAPATLESMSRKWALLGD